MPYNAETEARVEMTNGILKITQIGTKHVPTKDAHVPVHFTVNVQHRKIAEEDVAALRHPYHNRGKYGRETFIATQTTIAGDQK
jgi:hypothetical protein